MAAEPEGLRLQRLLAVPGNNVCADCGAAGAFRRGRARVHHLLPCVLG
jgi:hypothetical protein